MGEQTSCLEPTMIGKKKHQGFQLRLVSSGH